MTDFQWEIQTWKIRALSPREGMIKGIGLMVLGIILMPILIGIAIFIIGIKLYIKGIRWRGHFVLKEELPTLPVTYKDLNPDQLRTNHVQLLRQYGTDGRITAEQQAELLALLDSALEKSEDPTQIQQSGYGIQLVDVALAFGLLSFAIQYYQKYLEYIDLSNQDKKNQNDIKQVPLPLLYRKGILLLLIYRDHEAIELIDITQSYIDQIDPDESELNDTILEYCITFQVFCEEILNTNPPDRLSYVMASIFKAVRMVRPDEELVKITLEPSSITKPAESTE